MTPWPQISEWQRLLLPLLTRAAGALVVLVLAVAVYQVARRGLTAAGKRLGFSATTLTSLHKVLRMLAFVLATLLVLQQIGVLADAWTFISAMVAMFAVAFVAVWSVLSNAFCSLILLFARPFEVGDTVEVVGDNLRGKVVDFNWLFTTLRADDGDLIQIPNNLFFQKSIRRRLGTAAVSLADQLQSDRPADVDSPSEPPR